jgi:hypothetical protein
MNEEGRGSVQCHEVRNPRLEGGIVRVGDWLWRGGAWSVLRRCGQECPRFGRRRAYNGQAGGQFAAYLLRMGSFTPVQSAWRPPSPRAGTNPFRRFPSGSNRRLLADYLLLFADIRYYSLVFKKIFYARAQNRATGFRGRPKPPLTKEAGRPALHRRVWRRLRAGRTLGLSRACSQDL